MPRFRASYGPFGRIGWLSSRISPATITPDHPDQPAVGGATTKPITDIQPADTDPNQPPLIIIDATLEDEL